VDNKNYDPLTYVEADFFGEDDTRSNMIRLISEKLTKIINIPNMKDHGATGVTGCSEEHRLWQLLERRPHPSQGSLAHAFIRRHPGRC
jgi:hypothetical protein